MCRLFLRDVRAATKARSAHGRSVGLLDGWSKAHTSQIYAKELGSNMEGAGNMGIGAIAHIH